VGGDEADEPPPPADVRADVEIATAARCAAY
jgi:hypothetical protein